METMGNKIKPLDSQEVSISGQQDLNPCTAFYIEETLFMYMQNIA